MLIVDLLVYSLLGHSCVRAGARTCVVLCICVSVCVCQFMYSLTSINTQLPTAQMLLARCSLLTNKIMYRASLFGWRANLEGECPLGEV